MNNNEPLTVFQVCGTSDDFSDVGEYVIETYRNREDAEAHADRHNEERRKNREDNYWSDWDSYLTIVNEIQVK